MVPFHEPHVPVGESLAAEGISWELAEEASSDWEVMLRSSSDRRAMLAEGGEQRLH